MASKHGFSRENRVRLIYLVGDLLGKLTYDNLGGEIGSEPYFKLDDELRRSLGRLTLSPGLSGVDAINVFIQSAPEEELLTLIELTPYAKATAHAHHSYPPLHRMTDRDIKRVEESLNAFLGFTGSPARFDGNGNFDRDGFELADVGPLTYLPKKDQLITDVKRLLSEQELLSVILVDLDTFKGVNDRHGHDAGDKCLEVVSNTIAKCIARKGKLYRYREGDEFVAVLRNTTTDEARATAERIRGAIEARHPGGDVNVTASIGVASSCETGLDDTGRLLEAADKAMYVSKYTTKNCATAWPVSPKVMADVEEKRERTQGR